MPELPEIETTIRDLKKKIIGRKIVNIWTDFPKMISHIPEQAQFEKRKPGNNFPLFKKKIINRRIEKIWRAGKNIIFDLSGNLSLLIHQKLTGHLLYGKWKLKKKKWQTKEGSLRSDPANRFLHLIFWLDNNWQVALSDLRKFAKIELWQKEDLKNSRNFRNLGPDALKISFEEFKKNLKKKKGKIKQVLMDQTIISGIGNIYSNEIIFASRIHPLKKISELKEKNFKDIYQAMKRILKKAIELQGDSISDYRTIKGEKGGFDRLRKVYRKEGEPCPRCGALIKRIKVGGRSAYYCPKCQKL